MTAPVDRKHVTDELDKLIQRHDNLDLILGMIPSMFGSSEKATYLGFRAVGLGHRDCLMMLEQTQATYDEWCEMPHFEYMCNEGLAELRAAVSDEIVELEFKRNMSLFFMLDHRMLRKAHTDFNEMSESEAAYLRTARRYYTGKQLEQLAIALHPERRKDQTIVLQFGSSQPMYEIIEGEAEVVGGQKLLSEALPEQATKDRGVV